MKLEREPIILLRGARIVDPASGRDEAGDLIVRDGILERPAAGVPAGARVLDLGGRVVCPGFLDIHVHLREPGGDDSETVATGCAAAIRGGVTALYCMANTNPPNDDPEITRRILARAEEAGGLVDVVPVSAVTRRLCGEEMVDFEAQIAAGAGAFSDDGRPVMDEAMMARAMERAASLGVPIFSHAEDAVMSRGGSIREGEVSRALGVAGIPAEAESAAVARDIEIARRTGAPVHICHVSTAGSVRLLREAKAAGVPVTAETAPHYLALTVADLARGDTHFKMNPPLGSEEDRLEVRRGLAEGVFDAIATDHAPHSARKKRVALDRAAFGIIGMESLLPVLMTRVVDEGLMGLVEVLRLLTTGPAGVVGRPAPNLAEGARADLNVLDLETSYEIDVNRFESRSRNCPFDGWSVRGRVASTIVGDLLISHD